MDATRARVSSLFEWLAALACIIGVIAIGSVLVRDLSTVSAVAPVIAHEEPPAEPPATIPPRSVSVPLIVFGDGSALRVGDPASAVSAHVGIDAEVAAPAVDRTASGERMTRFFAHDGQRFVVVLQPITGEVRVAAIYLAPPR